MKKAILSFLVIALLVSAAFAQIQTCAVTGTVYQANGQPFAGAEIIIHRVRKANVLLRATPQKFLTNAQGQFSILLPRDSFAWIEAPIDGFFIAGGLPVRVPDAGSAELLTLEPVFKFPESVPVGVPAAGTLGFRDNGTPLGLFDTVDFKAGFDLTDNAGVIEIVSNPVQALGYTPARNDAPVVTIGADANLSNETVFSALVGRGTLASRPAAGIPGRTYYVTDSGSERWTRDNGTSWDDAAPHWSQIIGSIDVQVQIDGKQASDSDLTAIAGLSTTGLIVRTGAGTAVTRSIAQGTGIVVVNGDGVSGNPTVSIDQAFSPTWTGPHQFNENVTFGSKTTNFWEDLTPAVIIHRLNDRVFVGAATDNDGKHTNVVKDWMETLIPTSTSNSQLVSLATLGQVGVFGGSRSSDVTAEGNADGTIGIMGFGIHDDTVTVRGAHGGYFEGWLRNGAAIGAGKAASGVEIDIVNQHSGASAVDITPYAMFPAGLTNALWLASGGAKPSVFDSSVAIGILPNGSRFRKGVVFKADSLVGTDGDGSGSATVLEMAIGHQVVWRNSGGVKSVLDYNSIKLNTTSGTTLSGAKLHLQSDDGAGLNLQMDTYGTPASASNNIQLRAANGTAASPTQVLSGDFLGLIGGLGYHSGAAFAAGQSARIDFRASENFTSTAWGTYIAFRTTANGTNSTPERWRIAHGGWLIGKELTANPTTAELTAGDQIAIYVKADKLVIAYNQGGTIKYISIPLDGSTTTWTNSTSAP